MHATDAVDWVLWMDCDAAFTNMMIDWRLHIPLNTSKLMVVSEDKNGINLGVFLVPNTLQSREFISQMYQKRHYVEQMQFKWKDQSALIELMKDDPTIKSRIEVVPQRKLNAFLKDDRNKDGLKWQPYDWIMHQVLCREEPTCTYKYIWTLDGVAGREPDYSASLRWFNKTKEKGNAQIVNLTHPSLLLPKQSICNTSHDDIRNSRIHWYDEPSDTTISLYSIGKKTVGVQITAHKAKPALFMRKHIGRRALRAKQLMNLMMTANPFPTLNKVKHAEKAPDFDQYLGCDGENQTLRNTALLVTQNFGCDNLWHALANHHGVWTLLKVLNVSPSDVSIILPTEYAPFAFPPRTVSDVLWPLYTKNNSTNSPQQSNCFQRLIFIETSLNRPGQYWEQHQAKELCSADTPYMKLHKQFHSEARKTAMDVIGNDVTIVSKQIQPVVCYMSRKLRSDRIRYFSEEFAPVIEEVLDTWATKHARSIEFKRLEFDKDNVPFSKQIDETTHCNVLFGPHGAGFGHLIWMKSGVRGHEIKINDKEVYESLNLTLLVNVLDGAVAA
eukprot:scaffold7611_cov47-Cyclotella_meneghiniana.AAC.4